MRSGYESEFTEKLRNSKYLTSFSNAKSPQTIEIYEESDTQEDENKQNIASKL